MINSNQINYKEYHYTCKNMEEFNALKNREIIIGIICFLLFIIFVKVISSKNN